MAKKKPAKKTSKVKVKPAKPKTNRRLLLAAVSAITSPDGSAVIAVDGDEEVEVTCSLASPHNAVRACFFAPDEDVTPADGTAGDHYTNLPLDSGTTYSAMVKVENIHVGDPATNNNKVVAYAFSTASDSWEGIGTVYLKVKEDS